MKKESLLYLARAVSSVGDWMTFLAVALFLNEQFGSDKVAYGFLITSMPALIISSKAYQIIPQHWQRGAYLLGLGVLTLNVLGLTQANNLWHVYAYLLVASTTSAIIRPLLESLTAEAFDSNELDRILTRVGGLTSSILCIAPPLGAGLAGYLGYNSVFYIDAASFLVAGLLLMLVFKNTASDKNQDSTKAKLQLSLIKSPVLNLKELGLPKGLRQILLIWYVVLVLGAMINAGEFQMFSEFGYSKAQIGWVVGCWGLGGLIAFATASSGQSISIFRVLVPLYGLFLGTFFIASHILASCASFVAAGYLSAKLGGRIRAQIQQLIPSKTRSLEIWGLVNSRLSLINITIYGVVGYLIPFIGAQWIAIPSLAVAGIAVVIGFKCIK